MSEIIGKIFGWTSTVILTIDVSPQIVKIFATRSIKDISLLAYILRFSGNLSLVLFCTMAEGLNVQNTLPVVISSSITCILCSIVILLILFHKSDSNATKIHDTNVHASRGRVKAIETSRAKLAAR